MEFQPPPPHWVLPPPFMLVYCISKESWAWTFTARKVSRLTQLSPRDQHLRKVTGKSVTWPAGMSPWENGISSDVVASWFWLI